MLLRLQGAAAASSDPEIVHADAPRLHLILIKQNACSAAEGALVGRQSSPTGATLFDAVITHGQCVCSVCLEVVEHTIETGPDRRQKCLFCNGLNRILLFHRIGRVPLTSDRTGPLM
jgi:hypothetical protein